MSRVRPGARRFAAPLCLLAALASCGGDDEATPTTTTTAAECVPAPPVLRVDLIDEAVAAVEAERGGPQEYYEINATAQLVNLFVAGEADGEAVPYAFIDGQLSASEVLQGAQGSTFPASSLDFDPMMVTACVGLELPTATFEAFEVLGGPDGAVQYSIIARSQVGGQLIVSVTGDGGVLSADPV